MYICRLFTNSSLHILGTALFKTVSLDLMECENIVSKWNSLNVPWLSHLPSSRPAKVVWKIHDLPDVVKYLIYMCYSKTCSAVHVFSYPQFVLEALCLIYVCWRCVYLFIQKTLHDCSHLLSHTLYCANAPV